MKWLQVWWYIYLFTDCTGWTNFWCRARGHDDIVFYNPSGFEPDYHCKRCGEDLN